MSNKKEYIVISSESRTKIEDMMNDAFDDGMHFVDESIDCDQYRDVFRTIFDVMGHGQHFKRMISEAD